MKSLIVMDFLLLYDLWCFQFQLVYISVFLTGNLNNYLLMVNPYSRPDLYLCKLWQYMLLELEIDVIKYWELTVILMHNKKTILPKYSISGDLNT